MLRSFVEYGIATIDGITCQALSAPQERQRQNVYSCIQQTVFLQLELLEMHLVAHAIGRQTKILTLYETNGIVVYTR